MASRYSKQYNQELRRIRAFIRRAEKRGFRFEEIPGLEPNINPRKKDLERLQSLNQYSLYKYSTAISETGKVVRGTDRRKEERRAAAKKAQETKKRKKGNSGGHGPNAYDIIYNNLLNLIGQFPTKGSAYLKRLLENEIRRYGRKKVILAIYQSKDELIAMAQDIVHYEQSAESTNRALIAFADIIQGSIRSMEEEQALGDALEVGE